MGALLALYATCSPKLRNSPKFPSSGRGTWASGAPPFRPLPTASLSNCLFFWRAKSNNNNNYYCCCCCWPDTIWPFRNASLVCLRAVSARALSRGTPAPLWGPLASWPEKLLPLQPAIEPSRAEPSRDEITELNRAKWSGKEKRRAETAGQPAKAEPGRAARGPIRATRCVLCFLSQLAARSSQLARLKREEYLSLGGEKAQSGPARCVAGATDGAIDGDREIEIRPRPGGQICARNYANPGRLSSRAALIARPVHLN